MLTTRSVSYLLALMLGIYIGVGLRIMQSNSEYSNTKTASSQEPRSLH